MIGIRTQEALAVARERLAIEGRFLGNPNEAAALRRAAKANSAAVKRTTEEAKTRVENYRETLMDVDLEGAPPLRAAAIELNQREIEAPRGGRWHAASVARLRQRLSYPTLRGPIAAA